MNQLESLEREVRQSLNDEEMDKSLLVLADYYYDLEDYCNSEACKVLIEDIFPLKHSKAYRCFSTNEKRPLNKRIVSYFNNKNRASNIFMLSKVISSLSSPLVDSGLTFERFDYSKRNLLRLLASCIKTSNQYEHVSATIYKTKYHTAAYGPATILDDSTAEIMSDLLLSTYWGDYANLNSLFNKLGGITVWGPIIARFDDIHKYSPMFTLMSVMSNISSLREKWFNILTDHWEK